jgi:hypothetical protein
MTRNAKRGSIFAFATVAVEAVATYGRRSAHLLFDVLQGAYDTRQWRKRSYIATTEFASQPLDATDAGRLAPQLAARMLKTVNSSVASRREAPLSTSQSLAPACPENRPLASPSLPKANQCR